MWRVYKHTGKDKDYEVYKEALNVATYMKLESLSEMLSSNYHKVENQTVRVSMRIRSKQNVRDKVVPLEDNVVNKITDGELNLHFSSVFTREDTSSLPVPEKKVQ